VLAFKLVVDLPTRYLVDCWLRQRIPRGDERDWARLLVHDLGLVDINVIAVLGNTAGLATGWVVTPSNDQLLCDNVGG
jgi:hypothetical protein